MEQQKQPKYLETDAPGEDLYDGKPQLRVAQAIARVIFQGIVKLIGLDGTWGAGKSNVIRILQKGLENTHHFFVYDAWAHQEDPQRRVFLEEFTEDLIKGKVVKSNSWPEQLEKLLAKRRDTITRTIPKLSPAHYAVGITILLLIVSKSFSEMVCEDDALLRRLVEFAPAILLLIAWGIAACCSKEYRKISVMFSIYKERELEKVTSETITETEPTVRQFRDWMTRLSKDLGKRSVVVVFDNLDRLPADKVKALWSAIQTFLSEAKDHYPRISFIVPFDRAHISKIFGDGDANNSPFGSGFIDKTFPIIFTVALPPLTGWQGFFRGKFKEAFGAIPAGTYDQIEHIFDLYYPKITPRSIILFINELVSLRLIWNEEIEMRYMALFVAAKEEITKDPLNQILKRDFAGRADLYFKGDDELPKNIAALLYNVPLEMANQVALYREIQTAFRAQDTERIKTLHQHPDFFAILRKMIPGGELSVQDLVFVLSLLESNATSLEDKAAILQLWPSVAGKQIAQPGNILQFEPWIGTLLEKVFGGPKQWPLIDYIIYSFYNYPAGGTGESYFSNLSALDAVLKKHQLEDSMISRLSRKDVNPDYFLAYLSLAKDQYKRYKVSTNPVALDSWLVNMVGTEFPFFFALEYLDEGYSLPFFKKTLASYLESKDSNPVFLYPALFAYRQLEKKRPIKTPLSKERVQSLLQLGDINSDLLTELLAIRVATGGGSLINEPYGVLDSTTEPLIPAIARAVEYYVNLDELIGRGVLFGSAFSEAVIRYLIAEPSPASSVDLKKVLPKVNDIHKYLNIEISKVFEALDVWYKPTPGQHIMPVHYLNHYFPGFEFISSASQYPANRFAIDLIAVAKEYVLAAVPSDWLGESTVKSQFLFDLTLTLLKSNLLDHLPANAYQPFKDSLLKIAQGELPESVQLLSDNRDIYLQFLKTAAPPIGNLIVRTIRDTIEASKSAPPLTEFARFLDREYFSHIQIINATYSSVDHPEKFADVTEVMKKNIEHDRLLHGYITDETMGCDPDNGFLKKLTVDFKWAGREAQLEWKEGEYWRLPQG